MSIYERRQNNFSMIRKFIMVLHTILCVAVCFFILLFLSPCMLYYGISKKRWKPERFKKKVYIKSTWWAKCIRRTAGIRFHVSGLNNIPSNKTILYAANHQSNFDIIVCMCCLPGPKGFIAKIELLKIPLLRTWMKYMDCVFMDRKNIKQSLKVILEGIEILKNGHNMVVFPEGTRSRTGIIQDFKPGCFKLALKSGASIVPVTLNGSCKIFEGNGYKIRPADVYITIHQPIETQNITNDETAMLSEKVKNIIVSGFSSQNE